MLKASEYCRKKCLIPCHCRWEGHRSTSSVIDLSFNGALIRQSTPVPELGTNVVIELEVGGKSCPFAGEVVYADTKTSEVFGVHFTGDCDRNLTRLRPLYNSQLD